MCCKLLTVNQLQCIRVKRVVCFCLNQLIGTDIAERPIQDDNTSKKMLSKIAKKIKPLVKRPVFHFSRNYVYVIQEGHGEIAKVGCSVNPKDRRSDLQSGNSRKLTFRRVIELDENSDKLRAEKTAQKYIEVNKYATRIDWGGGKEWYDTSKYGMEAVAQKVVESLKASGDYKADVTYKFKNL